MNRYRRLMHWTGLVVSLSLIAPMVATRLDGRTGHLTDVAIGILVLATVWHFLALRSILTNTYT